MTVYVIWLSNEEQSDILGVSSSKEKALGAIAPLVDVSTTNQREREHGVIVLDVDYYTSFILVPIEIDGELLDFERVDYNLEEDDLDGDYGSTAERDE